MAALDGTLAISNYLCLRHAMLHLIVAEDRDFHRPRSARASRKRRGPPIGIGAKPGTTYIGDKVRVRSRRRYASSRCRSRSDCDQNNRDYLRCRSVTIRTKQKSSCLPMLRKRWGCSFACTGQEPAGRSYPPRQALRPSSIRFCKLIATMTSKSFRNLGLEGQVRLMEE